MKIYLASYLQPDNFGSGRKISICWDKPKEFKLDGCLEWLIPSKQILRNYKNNVIEDPDNAGPIFEHEFNQQLKESIVELKNIAKEKSVSIQDLVGLQDEDTLLSYERFENKNYRPIVAKHLESLKYEIILK